MKAIYEFYWDCGRQGDVSGTFIANKEDVEKAIGSEVYFGEILGKHSEIHGTLDEDDLVIKSEDQDFIAKFETIMGVDYSSGHNPLNYIDDEAEDEDEEA